VLAAHGPGEGARPGRGSGFGGIGAALEVEFDELCSTPAYGPGKGCAFEEFVAGVEACAGVESGGGEGGAFVFADVFGFGGNSVEHRDAVARGFDGRAGLLKQDLEALQVELAVPIGARPRTRKMVPKREAVAEGGVPTLVSSWPI
jgi:hypothetical protein